MTEEILELQKKIKVLEQQLADKERIIKDPSKRGYFALVKTLNQQIEYLEDFSLKIEIGVDPKGDKTYDRAEAMWKGLKNMILDCRLLKQELNVTSSEEEKELRKLQTRITPETVAEATAK